MSKTSVELIEALEKYSDADLADEIERRKQIRIENKKDRTARPFFREIVKSGTAIKKKMQIINSLSPAQQESMHEENGVIYIMDIETPEEIATRLSRKATYREDYDQWITTFYENGEEIAERNYESMSSAKGYADSWECDKWAHYFIEEYMGRSSWYPEHQI